MSLVRRRAAPAARDKGTLDVGQAAAVPWHLGEGRANGMAMTDGSETVVE